jgi:hypothetical protein
MVAPFRRPRQRARWPRQPPLAQRVARAVATYGVVAVLIAGLLQVFTPFTVLSWIGRAIRLPAAWTG